MVAKCSWRSTVRSIFRGGTVEKLGARPTDARRSGIYGMQSFARALRYDIEAVRNAVLEPRSNGRTEGQINNLKTLKRTMYGRAGVDLLRAKLMLLNRQPRTERESDCNYNTST